MRCAGFPFLALSVAPAGYNIADMQAQPTAAMALKHAGVIVGIKSAHFNGPEWDPYIQAEEAGKIANIPVMVDFGSARVRTIAELFQK